MWKSVLIVAALTSFAVAPASAEQCRDAKGKFVKCETTKKKVQCKVSGKLTPSGVVRAFGCNSDIRCTNCELLCLRLALEPETSI